MKICLIIDDYLPHSIKIGAKMLHELGVELVARGHTVTVVTPVPALAKPYEIELFEGVTVCRFRSGPIKNISKVRRAINETLLAAQAWQSCKNYFIENPHDLIVYYSPTIFFGGLVRKLKALWGAKSYLILRDFFPQWAIDSGLLKSDSMITRYFRFFEGINYRAADKIAVQSQKNALVFSALTHRKYTLDVLYNWASTTGFVRSTGKYRNKLSLNGKIVFFYGGNIGHAQDMMNIVRLAQRMRAESRAHFLIVGRGDEFDLMQDAIDKDIAGNMTLLPSVSQDEYAQMLAECDVGLFSLHRDHTAHNFPGKLLGYMLQELPILGSINPDNDLKDVVEGAEAGLVSINGDDDQFFANAMKLMNDDFRKNMGKNAAQLLEQTFSVKTAANKVLAVCE
jgi:glycosyltransferase involved in cell wall biosynthesis